MTTESPKGTVHRGPETDAAAEPTLRYRGAGFALVQECLRIQDASRRRSLVEQLFGADPIVPRARFSYRGGLGEVEVASVLDALGPGWFVVHEVPIGVAGSNVHHVIIGPSGVFTLSLHNHTGREVWVSSQAFMAGWEDMPHIRDAEVAANVAATLLSEAIGFAVDVTPSIIVLDSRSLTIAKPPRRVAVLTARQLWPWLAGLPQVMSPHEVALLGMYSEERSTWHEPPSQPDTVREQVHRFRQLQDEVSTARRRRVIWTTGGIVIAWCAFIASLGGAAVGLVSLLLPH